MSLQFTHKPNYFFFAQTFAHFLTNTLQKNQYANTNFTFELADIYNVFHQDFASTTANLESILHIVKGYAIGNQEGERLVSEYKIDSDANTLNVQFNSVAVDALKQGQTLVAPDAVSYDY